MIKNKIDEKQLKEYLRYNFFITEKELNALNFCKTFIKRCEKFGGDE